jgi:hypothetical protein
MTAAAGPKGATELTGPAQGRRASHRASQTHRSSADTAAAAGATAHWTARPGAAGRSVDSPWVEPLDAPSHARRTQRVQGGSHLGRRGSLQRRVSRRASPSVCWTLCPQNGCRPETWRGLRPVMLDSRRSSTDRLARGGGSVAGSVVDRNTASPLQGVATSPPVPPGCGGLRPPGGSRFASPAGRAKPLSRPLTGRPH